MQYKITFFLASILISLPHHVLHAGQQHSNTEVCAIITASAIFCGTAYYLHQSRKRHVRAINQYHNKLAQYEQEIEKKKQEKENHPFHQELQKLYDEHCLIRKVCKDYSRSRILFDYYDPNWRDGDGDDIDYVLHDLYNNKDDYNPECDHCKHKPDPFCSKQSRLHDINLHNLGAMERKKS